MKRLATIVLKVVALGIPMVIAACYGAPATYSRRGKVIDQETHDLLADIKVACLNSAGTETDSSITGSDGVWSVWYDSDCAKLEASDTQSPARYQTKQVDFPTNDESTISLTKVP